ncbi:MAG: ATP-binding protein [Beijerinckiaceae bacterium]|nr:ATP-binding protein [Beijerinckiaceae bacterium]
MSRSTIVFHQLLVAAAIIVPAAAFLAAAMENRRDVLREGESAVVRTVAVMDEHARKVFDTVDLALGRVDDRVRGLTSEQVASPETSAFLRQLKAPLQQAVSIWVTDASGHVQAGSQDWDRSVSIRERDFFSVQRDGMAGPYVSRAFVGRATNVPSFAVSRPRTSLDGKFAGIIHVAVSPDYFASFFNEAAPPGGHSALLFRKDGSVLARDPPWGSPAVLPADSAFMRFVSEATKGQFRSASPIDGEKRFYAYRYLEPYSIYVAFGLSDEAMLQRWRNNLQLYGAVAAAASVFLLLLSLLALRRVRAEQEALVQLRIQNEQRLLAEQRLFQAQKMESIGQLTGEIAHDFNNLLAIVLGNLGMLRKLVVGNERAERLVSGALQGAERGASLTKRLLAFARRQDLAPQSVDLAKLVTDLVDLIRHTSGPGIEVVLDLDDDVTPVHVDPNQLELAILNLAVNARDAMPEGGVLTVSLSGHDLDSSNGLNVAAGRYACLAVTDSGSGMSEDTLARASEPFFTTKAVGKGTGLGVSIVHGLAVQSGGAFRLLSQLKQGTRAEIWLPASQEQPANPAGHEIGAASTDV